MKTSSHGSIFLEDLKQSSPENLTPCPPRRSTSSGKKIASQARCLQFGRARAGDLDEEQTNRSAPSILLDVLITGAIDIENRLNKDLALREVDLQKGIIAASFRSAVIKIHKSPTKRWLGPLNSPTNSQLR